MIPTETDLNMLPFLSSIPDKVLPLASAQAKTNTGIGSLSNCLFV